MTHEFLVERELFIPADPGKEGASLGRVWCDNLYLGFTLEDEDRRLEIVGKEGKVYGKTAIPRGRYRLVLDFSDHFQKVLPHILDVPTHAGVRIHGANDASQLEGCIAVGLARTERGVAKCSTVVDRIISILVAAEDVGEPCYIEVK